MDLLTFRRVDGTEEQRKKNENFNILFMNRCIATRPDDKLNMQIPFAERASFLQLMIHK